MVNCPHETIDTRPLYIFITILGWTFGIYSIMYLLVCTLENQWVTQCVDHGPHTEHSDPNGRYVLQREKPCLLSHVPTFCEQQGYISFQEFTENIGGRFVF